MTNLKARILKAAAFNYSKAHVAARKIYDEHFEDPELYRLLIARGSGAEWQHTQLKPLLEALAECADELDRYRCDNQPEYDDSKPCKCGDCEALRNLESVLALAEGETN